MTEIKRYKIKHSPAKAAGRASRRSGLMPGTLMMLALFTSAYAADMSPGLVADGTELGTRSAPASAENLYPSRAKIDTGFALIHAGNLNEAEQLFREVLQNSPDPVRAHYGLGLVYEKQGDFVRAIAEFKEGIRKHQQGRK